jgi:hypothetical protein
MEFKPTTPDSEIYRRNEDATHAANKCAGTFAGAEKIGTWPTNNPELNLMVLEAMYRAVFDAFIHGVEYGRKIPGGDTYE